MADKADAHRLAQPEIHICAHTPRGGCCEMPSLAGEAANVSLISQTTALMHLQKNQTAWVGVKRYLVASVEKGCYHASDIPDTNVAHSLPTRDATVLCRSIERGHSCVPSVPPGLSWTT